jgi:hypothetical protein
MARGPIKGSEACLRLTQIVLGGIIRLAGDARATRLYLNHSHLRWGTPLLARTTGSSGAASMPVVLHLPVRASGVNTPS